MSDGRVVGRKFQRHWEPVRGRGGGCHTAEGSAEDGDHELMAPGHIAEWFA